MMNRQEGNQELARFIRLACRLRGVSLSEASRGMGRSRSWLERIVNYDSETKKGIRRPSVESCKDIARYFGEDPNHVLQLAGYVTPASSPSPVLDQIISVGGLLSYDDQLALLEQAQLLRLRASTSGLVEVPEIAGIEWDQLGPVFASRLAEFIRCRPATLPIWVEALRTLPSETVQLLLFNAWSQVELSGRIEGRATRFLNQLARQL